MIRYPDALDRIFDAVQREAPRWTGKARKRTDIFAELGKYTEEYVGPLSTVRRLPPFWSEVKPFYMRFQYNKCIYCETKLEGNEFATVQWDLEHFRPKSNVRKWPDEKRAQLYDFPTGDEWNDGYYLLAYHLGNYAAACKTCNSPFKSDFFPIASGRIGEKRDPRDYDAEEPYLVYPLGPDDEDPDDLIDFEGADAVPRATRSHDERKWRRARIMIDFFGLNRDGLVSSRAWWLLNAVWPNAVLADYNDPTGEKNMRRLRSERAPFTNCTNSYMALFRSHRTKAEEMIAVFETIVDAMDDSR